MKKISPDEADKKSWNAAIQLQYPELENFNTEFLHLISAIPKKLTPKQRQAVRELLNLGFSGHAGLVLKSMAEASK